VSYQKTNLKPGQEVYARWFGDDKLTIVRLADLPGKFPHYICELEKSYYLISKIQLSTSRIIPEVDDGNRNQLKFAFR
jgi:hypothetical protein